MMNFITCILLRILLGRRQGIWHAWGKKGGRPVAVKVWQWVRKHFTDFDTGTL
jgi:hypothetical protein